MFNQWQTSKFRWLVAVLTSQPVWWDDLWFLTVQLFLRFVVFFEITCKLDFGIHHCFLGLSLLKLGRWRMNARQGWRSLLSGVNNSVGSHVFSLVWVEQHCHSVFCSQRSNSESQTAGESLRAAQMRSCPGCPQLSLESASSWWATVLRVSLFRGV